MYNIWTCRAVALILTVEDLERNDGSLQKPYFMSKNLMKILNKSNKVQKQGKGKDWGAEPHRVTEDSGFFLFFCHLSRLPKLICWFCTS